MKLLFVGGSGYVGGLLLPHLARRHQVRVLDLRAPKITSCEYLAGSATDHRALDRALRDQEVVLHGAMSVVDETDPGTANAAFEVNVTSVYQTLAAARRAGVGHAVYLSSLSVYRDVNSRRLDDSMPPDAYDVYGLSKRFGEEVCRAAVAEGALSVNALRLAWPTPDEHWPAWAGELPAPPERWYAPDGTPIHATAATDLAAAVLAALEYRNGYQVFTISGDESARLWSTASARERLGWAPTFGASR